MNFVKTLFEVLDACDQRRGTGNIKQVVPILWGQQGVGKSSLVRQWAESRQKTFIPLYFGQFDSPGDVLGMPYIKDERTYVAKPDWFPTSKNVVLFCDEINRANNLVSQLLHGFLLDRRVGQHVLLQDTFVVAAANPPESQFHVAELDSAVMDRLLHISVTDAWGDGWVTWAFENNLDRKILNYILEFREFIRHVPTPPMREKPSRRSWEMLSLLVQGNDLSDDALQMMFIGLLGYDFGSNLWSWWQKRDFPISVMDIIDNYGKVRMKVKVISSLVFRDIQTLASLCERLRILLPSLTKEQKQNVKQFVADIPPECRSSFPQNDLFDIH